jgi:hypothetical protein
MMIEVFYGFLVKKPMMVNISKKIGNKSLKKTQITKLVEQ